MNYYIGTDIGGTFTDLVMLSDAGEVTIVKSPTTPSNRTKGVLDALEVAAGDLGIEAKALVKELAYFAHGTTAATNAFIERKGVKTGLSHDPRGPRACWIDEPLDRSVLEALAEGEPDRLSSLYTFDSDTFRGGTGEIRNWLVVGGAMGDTKATIVDYMPVHHIITGCGFAYWGPSPTV